MTDNSTPASGGKKKSSVFDDFEKLKLPLQGSGETVATVITQIEIRRPTGDPFVRVHETDRLAGVGLYTDGDGTRYMVLPEVAEHPTIARYMDAVTLHRAVDQDGREFIWAVPFPTENEGRLAAAWNQPHRQAASEAVNHWLRIYSGKKDKANPTNGWVIDYAKIDLGEPRWREKYSFKDLLNIAFNNCENVMDSLDHPIVKRLLGLSK